MKNTVKLKVASANINQTIANFTRNVPNIKAAIDAAVNDGANVLTLQELGLTGYSGDDYFKWIRSEAQQQEILDLVKDIADYANAKDPNLVISMGFPLFYKDETQPVRLDNGNTNPLYNIGKRPFNAQAFISGGKIDGISLKSTQPDGAAEYEPRQFILWPDNIPNQQIELPHFGKVPIGNVIVQLVGEHGEKANLYHEICAEGWPGIGDDGKVNEKEAREGRFLNQVVKNNDISLVINPSASKPEPYLDKPELRALLSTIGSKICRGAGYIYTNCLGLEAAPIAFEGGSIFVENGEVTHKSRRYSMADVEYSSSVMTLPVAEKGAPDAVVQHDFTIKNAHQNKGGPDAFEAIDDDFARRAEETLRNTALWIRDYLKKTGLQGFVVSLSGGADSAFGAVAISQAIDLNIKQLEGQLGDRDKAVESFITQFPRLKYEQEVLETLKEKGADEAIAVIKHNMLTCIYLPSDNSGDVTLNAARTLIEGGEVNGKHVDGIGGKFEVVNVQTSVDSLIEAFAGVTSKDLLGKYIDDPAGGDKQVSLKDRLSIEFREYVAGTRQTFSDKVEEVINHKDPSRRLSWVNPEDDITLQNIQARARQPYPWMFGNKEHKIACVTSNWSEAVAGYWTFGGDGHMGAINLCGGVPKSQLKKMLRYLEEKGLDSLEAIPALNPVNVQIPTAELRPTEQSDEADMMPYKMLDAIGESIFFYKNTPLEAYKQLKLAKDPDDETKPLFAKQSEPTEVDKEYLIECIDKACKMWHRSQFKRVGAVITPFLGQNVDPHTSVRTTILSDGFQTSLAQLKLEYLKETLGTEFKPATGFTEDELGLKSKIDSSIRDLINQTPVTELADKLKNYDPRLTKLQSIAVGGI